METVRVGSLGGGGPGGSGRVRAVGWRGGGPGGGQNFSRFFLHYPDPFFKLFVNLVRFFVELCWWFFIFKHHVKHTHIEVPGHLVKPRPPA